MNRIAMLIGKSVSMKLYIDTFKPLYVELKKNFRFFVLVGIIVGGLLVLQFKLKQLGFSKEPFWADSLFDNFISPHALVLFFSMLLITSSIKSLLNSAGINWKWLDNIVSNIETHLMQLSSIMVLFSLGLGVAALAYYFFVESTGGIKLFKELMGANILIILWCLIASFICRINESIRVWQMSITWGVFGLSIFVFQLLQ